MVVSIWDSYWSETARTGLIDGGIGKGPLGIFAGLKFALTPFYRMTAS